MVYCTKIWIFIEKRKYFILLPYTILDAVTTFIVPIQSIEFGYWFRRVQKKAIRMTKYYSTPIPQKSLHHNLTPRSSYFVDVSTRPRRRVDQPLSILSSHLDQYGDKGASKQEQFYMLVWCNNFSFLNLIETIPPHSTKHRL